MDSSQDNIMVDKEGSAVLADAEIHHLEQVYLAREGAIPDNWRYLSPSDVKEWRPVSDSARDVYAFGNLFYEVRYSILQPIMKTLEQEFA
jgi:hypothetical protein